MCVCVYIYIYYKKIFLTLLFEVVVLIIHNLNMPFPPTYFIYEIQRCTLCTYTMSEGSVCILYRCLIKMRSSME